LIYWVDNDAVAHSKTTWVNATIFSKKDTELVKYLKKGQLVYLKGKPDVLIYRDKKGEPHINFKLVVSTVKLLGGKISKVEESSAKDQSLESASIEKKLPNDLRRYTKGKLKGFTDARTY